MKLKEDGAPDWEMDYINATRIADEFEAAVTNGWILFSNDGFHGYVLGRVGGQDRQEFRLRVGNNVFKINIETLWLGDDYGYDGE